MGKFVYRGKNRTADDIAKKAKEGSRDYDGIFMPGLPVFKPKEGENCIRVLPSADEDHPDWDLVVHSHYNVGADNARYLCLSKMQDKDCPVCDELPSFDEEEQDALRAQKGAICWIIDRDNEKAGPQLWPIPFTKVRNEIYERSVDKKSRVPILVDDPEEGFDIVFMRKGTDQRTQYTGVEVLRESSPLHDNPKIQERWLAYVTEHPLVECLNYYEAAYIKKVLFGKAAKKADEEDDEAPSTRRRLKREEDEEDEASPRSRRSRSSSDEDPDDAPRSRRSSREDPDDDIPFEGSRSRRRALLDENDGGGEDEDKPTSRRARKPVEEEEGDEGEDTPSDTAKRTLGRLRTASQRGR